jgi:hypothetical protein
LAKKLSHSKELANSYVNAIVPKRHLTFQGLRRSKYGKVEPIIFFAERTPNIASVLRFAIKLNHTVKLLKWYDKNNEFYIARMQQ